MGQGFALGVTTGMGATLATAVPLTLGLNDCLMIMAGSGVGGLAIDLVSDINAKKGKVLIDREAILAASDDLVHVYSFYAINGCNPVSKFLQQKHEWVVLESKSRKYFCVQKCPSSGNISLESRSSLRQAIDCGLREAHRPVLTGETRMHRRDHEFDLPDDLQLAYVIAWLRKEEPRWSLTTENSRHFGTKIRTALNDF